jgi:predicted O-methyltransferase YrrM
VNEAMDKRIQVDTENFVLNLTCANRVEIQGYFAEIKLNKEFYDRIEENQRVSSGIRNSSWNFSIGETLGAVLYAICRKQKPEVVVETGVASGVSSSFILCALEQNKHGQLYSIDLPWWQDYESGWRIPNYLRHRWHLIQGKSSKTLLPLLEKVAEVDIFLHDSDHTYQNMLWEYRIVWKYLKPRGLLLSHNIDTNDAFSDFCHSSGVRGYSLTNMGGTAKD